METRMNKWASKREAIIQDMRKASKKQLVEFVLGNHDYSSHQHAPKPKR